MQYEFVAIGGRSGNSEIAGLLTCRCCWWFLSTKVGRSKQNFILHDSYKRVLEFFAAETRPGVAFHLELYTSVPEVTRVRQNFVSSPVQLVFAIDGPREQPLQRLFKPSLTYYSAVS